MICLVWRKYCIAFVLCICYIIFLVCQDCRVSPQTLAFHLEIIDLWREEIWKRSHLQQRDLSKFCRDLYSYIITVMDLYLFDNSSFPTGFWTNEGKTAERVEALLKINGQTLHWYKIDVDLLTAIKLQFSVSQLVRFSEKTGVLLSGLNTISLSYKEKNVLFGLIPLKVSMKFLFDSFRASAYNILCMFY